MRRIYHVIANLGGIEPPKLAAIPPYLVAVHSRLAATKIWRLLVGTLANTLNKRFDRSFVRLQLENRYIRFKG
ncbi:hypothetical protein [Allocoleopsis franciscana]|uniref:Uncharacterized protein n=1 Tax=Allocoleopsis franciscana PCC 7113 TaxID=1173027 RepID=K9WFQ6_9CYAN|nr:hypothetical protein [Allocoleopsis franciscana]AFZ19048.1 hypothetical protein Mic7113_3316 [Allocoleopsis franciscana PCC 7113]